MSFWSSAFSWISGSSISASLAKTALLGYASKLLSDNVNENNTGNVVDPGTRLQLNPSTETKIPILYGEAFFGGNIIDAQLSADYKKMSYCLALTELTNIKLSNNQGTIYSWKNVYINNNRVVFKADGFTVDYTVDAGGNQDISLRDLVKIYVYFESTGVQPQGYSGTTPSPYTTMPGWASNTHSMPELMYAVVEVTYSRANNVNSLPELLFNVVSDMTKPGDVLVDYMLNTYYGAGIPLEDIDLDSFRALNTWADTGYVYENLNNQNVTAPIDINGLVDPNTEVLANMEELAKCSNSWLSFDIHKGQWVVVINRAGDSVASMTDSNIIGEISISGTSLTQLNNVANIKYQNTDILDKSDFVKITLPTEDLYDNEPSSTLEVTLAFTNRQTTAYLVGSQLLKQGRVDKIISFTTDYSYVNLRAGDIIDITSPVYGFTNKKFRVITVQETQNDAGDIQIQFTALEYDADVYVTDVSEFAVETDDGILGIGSIGKPDTPTVTKTEQANVPKIVISADVPSGIVDAIEFWLTFDTGVTPDSARTYIPIGSVQNPDGSQLTENDTVNYTYSGLGQSDFLIKVRGVNAIATGPYSDPTGLIEYVPIVVADTLSDTPVSIGGQLMSLGLLTLLNNLDKLFDGDASIWEIFTGAGEEAGTGPTNTVGVSDEGTSLGPASSFNFTGAGVTATAASGVITVNVPGATGGGGGSTVNVINDLADVDTVSLAPRTGDRLIWSGNNWIPDGQGTGSIPDPDPTEPGALGSCGFSFSKLYPPDEAEASDSFTETPYDSEGYSSDKAPITGSYFVKFSDPNGGNLIRGTTGNARLYKSNGTLVQTLSFNQINIDRNTVELPFSNRERGVDYYIAMDAGMVVSAYGCTNNPIFPGSWNFNTPWEDIDPYNIPADDVPINVNCFEVFHRDFQARSLFQLPSIFINVNTGNILVPQWDKTKAHRQTDLYFTFNVPVVLNGDGFVEIYTSSGTLVQRIDGAQAAQPALPGQENNLLFCTGRTLRIDPTVDFIPGQSYYVVVGPNTIRNTCRLKWSGLNDPIYTAFTVDPGPVAAAPTLPSNGSINEEPVALTFDRPVVAGGGSIIIRDGSNNIVGTVASNSPAVTYTQGV